MRQLKKYILPLLVIAVLMGPAYIVVRDAIAAATGKTYNTSVSASEIAGPGNTWVMYSGVTPTTVATDSIGDFYTKAMWIPEYNNSNCFFDLKCYNSATGTEDMNVYVEYSYDRTTWFVGAANSGEIYDQLTTTRVSDTLNVIVGSIDTFYRCAPWMRLHFDLQAGNPIGTYANWKLVFRKSADAIGVTNKVATTAEADAS